MIATVSASEQTGDLSLSLRRYAEHQQSVRALRDKVVGATIYPALLLGVGLLVVVFLLGVVVPSSRSSSRAPGRNCLELAVDDVLGRSRPVMPGNWAPAHWSRDRCRDHGSSVLRDGAKARWIDALPFVGSTVRKFRHAQLYRTTGMLVRGASPRRAR